MMGTAALSRSSFLASAGAAAVAGVAVPSAGAAPVPLGIEVTSHPALEYAIPIVVAQQLGYTVREGITIRTIAGSSGGGTEIRSLTQGGLDLGMVSTGAAIKAILAGEDLKIVGGGAQTAGTLCWVVKKDSPIRTIHDLIGKKVGFTAPGSVSETALILSLQAAKIDPASVQTMPGGGVGGNMTLLNTGGLDCAFTLDPTLAQYADQVRVVFWARDYLPHFMQNVWITTSEMTRKNLPALDGFFRAWARGVDYVQGHPLQSARIYANAWHQDERLFAITLAQDKPASFFGQGQLNVDGLTLAVKAMRIGKLLGPDKISLAAMCDQDALPAALRTKLPASV